MNCDPSATDYFNASMLVCAVLIAGLVIGWLLRGRRGF